MQDSVIWDSNRHTSQTKHTSVILFY